MDNETKIQIEKNHALTIEEVESKIKDVYLLVDVGIVRVTLAAAIANRVNLHDKPVWLLILAGSSAGKTIMLQLLDKCGAWIHPIDTLTTNTFASGLQRDEEVSLLRKANNGVLVFKDFTTITTMNEEGQREIMGQLRAIYDGSFDKKTGNANDVKWVGKIGIIAAGTIAVQRKMRQYSENGERFLNYIIKVADPKDITRKAMANQKDIKMKETELAEIVKKFVNQKLSEVFSNPKEIPPEIEEEMVQVADFCTMARSPVQMNKKNPAVVDFVPDREMPPRMAMMLKNIAVSLMVISGEELLSEFNAKIIYKIGLDSIPVERRMMLRILAQYREATTRNIAIKTNYTTETVKAWLTQLNALKMVDRIGSGGGGGDKWELRKEYADIMCKYEGITREDAELYLSDEEEGNAYVDSEENQRDEEYLNQITLDDF